VSVFSASPVTATPSAGKQPHALARAATTLRSFRWLTRPRRVLLLLSAVWVLNIFDLGYTLLESLHCGFVELNPLAARIIGGAPEALVLYKTGLLTVSTAILLGYRRHRVAELGCWFLLVVYLYVAVCWCLYYHQRLAALEDPAVNVDPLIGCCLR